MSDLNFPYEAYFTNVPLRKSLNACLISSKEELIAEMGTPFLCGMTGIANSTLGNSAAYIQGWLNKLEAEPKLLIHAASLA